MTGPASPLDNDIAIVGMAGRFPGAPTLTQFWRNLREGVESVVTFSPEALRAEGVPDALLHDPLYVPRGAVLEDMEYFDGGFFGFSPKESDILDPQHRHFLECCWHALEDAGHPPERFPGSIGVFGGSGMHAYMMFNLLSHPELMEDLGLFLVRHTGNDKDFFTTRVSYALNLRGPSLNVQTACSTSLVAVHLACQHLLSGECDLALAGGATIELPHRVGYLVREGEILSPDGHCRPFDAAAQGTVFGSGVGVVVLRRLADALADGDSIRAIVKGSAVNNDGSLKVGYLAPSVDGQAAAITEALAVAGVSPDTVTYVEAHGTGTAVGDPIEVAALTQAFRTGSSRRGYCVLGSVKSNIGHTDTAAGVASLIKATLALEHRELPPTLHYRTANPAIDFADSPFIVTDRLQPWDNGGQPRRAGVSSLGVGGTNAHVVLEEAPRLPERRGTAPPWNLLPFSARSDSALDRQALQLADHLRVHPHLTPSDVAFTLQEGRAAFAHRRALVCGNLEEAATILEEQDRQHLVSGRADGERRALAFLFAGGGAQYPGMGADIYQHEPVYREAIAECAVVLDREAAVPLLDLLREGREAAELERPSLGLPALFATQYAQAQLLRSYGLEPTALIGHSMGEYTAACLAGVFSLTDALRLVALRGRLFEQVPAGGMLSVQASPAELEPLLPPELSIAAINAPGLCVASGPTGALDHLAGELSSRNIEYQRIHIAVAAHSAMLDAILEPFRTFLQGLRLSPPAVPVVSNLTGTWLRDEEATNPEYWVRHLRHTVKFADGIGVLLAHDARMALLEIGPGTTLTSLTRLHPVLGPNHLALASQPRAGEQSSSLRTLMESLARLWVNGVEWDWKRMRRGEPRQRIPLPLYPFERRRHWIDARPAEPVPLSTAPTEEESRSPDPGAWLYRRGWRPAAESPAPGQSLDWLLMLTDDDSLGAILVGRAAGTAQRVVVVHPGADFAIQGPNRYQVRPGDTQDFARLLQEVGRPAGRGGVLHAWALRSSAGDESRARGLDTLLSCVTAAAEECGGAPLRLVSLTPGDHSDPVAPAADPYHALIPATLRVIPREFPEIEGLAIEVTVPPPGSRGETLLADQLLAATIETGSGVIRLEPGLRLVEDYARLPAETSSPKASLVREGGVYLITGGLGALGLLAAGELARLGAGTLILASRSGTEPREEWARLAADPTAMAERYRQLRSLEALGCRVVAPRVDVTDAPQVKTLVDQIRAEFGALHGIVHAAGRLDDAPLLAKERTDLDRVLGPKVAGTLNLDAALGDHPLDFFLLYSSVSAVAGIPGQVDYAAANAFLDAFAVTRTNRTGSPTISIGWPAWRQVGMVAAPDSIVPGATPGPVPAHPLLEQRWNHPDGTAEFVCRLGPDRHWLLDDHRLRTGEALIPGAGFIELARAAAQESLGTPTLTLSEMYFTTPFLVADGTTRELRILVTREGEITLRSPDPGRAGMWIDHVSGRAARGAAGPGPDRADLTAMRARCRAPHEGDPVKAMNAHLRFGARWQGGNRTFLGSGEALVELHLDEAFAGDLKEYALHPALLDLATAGAQGLIAGHDPDREFFVPVGYRRLELFHSLPGRCVSHIRYRTGQDEESPVALFDVTIVDAEGTPLVRVEEFTMQLVGDSTRLASSAQDLTPVETATTVALSLGVEPSEGLAVLRRVLGGKVPPHILVSPHPIQYTLRTLSSPAGIPEAVRPPPADSLRVDTDREDPGLGEVAVAMREHPAVQDAAVVGKHESGAPRRLLAYFVRDPSEPLTISELRRHVRGRVVEALVPPNFVEVDTLLRGAQGELLHVELPDPFARADDHVAPATETEKWLSGIWSEVLGTSRISRHDNFFDIGGHSLLGIRVITRVRKERGVRLSQADMVLQTLEQLAEACDRSLAGQLATDSE